MILSSAIQLTIFGGGAVIGIIVLEPSIIFKLYNLILSLLSAVIGVSLGLFISTKAIDYVACEYFNGRSSQSPPSSQGNMQSFSRYKCKQNIPLQEDANVKKNSLFIRIWKATKFFFKSILKVLSKSPILQSQLRNTHINASHSHVYDAVKPLGRVPEKPLHSGNYICVSSNVDMMMQRIFEYSYRDYVETWYAQVSSDHGKLRELVKADFWETFQVFSERLSKLDIVNLIMNQYIKTLLQHFQDIDATDPLKKNSNASFKLHPCLRDRNSELEFLRRVSDYIIVLCFPESITINSSSRLILREILAGLTFLPMVDTLCDPDYINLTILMAIQRRETAEEEKTRAYMYAATYEDFIKIINESSDINELQQIRYHIVTEVMHATTINSLKKDYRKAGKARSMAKGELLITRNLKRYINQCQVAKLQCEKRIRSLGGGEFGSRMTHNDEEDHAFLPQVQLLSFSEVMSSAMARSFFLKYLKKIDKASLLKYWNEIDIIRSTKPTGKDLAKLVSHVYQTYVLPGNADELPIEIDRVTLRGMQTCVVGNKAPDDFYKVQDQVYNILEKDHYPSFVVSDFYISQLMPHIRDEEQKRDFGYSDNMEENTQHNAAFGSRKCASDGALQRLEEIDEKLEYKAQALESMKPSAKPDSKVTRQLEQEISELQQDKLKQQLHIERTEAWWSRMGSWNASIDKVQLLSTDGENSKVPVYTIVVLCSGVPFYEATDNVSGWVAVRSLDEFQKLHQSLREFRPWLKKRRLPSLPMLRLRGLSDKFLQNSKEVLNEYLQDVLKDEILRCSELVYSFLSQSPEPSHDQVGSGKRQRLSSITLHKDAVSGDTGQGVRKRSLWQIGGLLMNLPRDFVDYVRHSEDEEETSDVDELDNEESLVDRDSIAGPMYELISEIFEIQGLFRPLRRTLIVFVRLAFGGTINKQIRDTLQWLVSDSMLTYYLQIFVDSMWPDGQLRQAPVGRTEEEKIQTALEVQVKIMQNIPEALQSFVGQENARRGMLKIYRALQDKRLNKHLFYNLLSVTVEEIFPEIIRNPDD